MLEESNNSKLFSKGVEVLITRVGVGENGEANQSEFVLKLGFSQYGVEHGGNIIGRIPKGTTTEGAKNHSVMPMHETKPEDGPNFI